MGRCAGGPLMRPPGLANRMASSMHPSTSACLLAALPLLPQATHHSLVETNNVISAYEPHHLGPCMD